MQTSGCEGGQGCGMLQGRREEKQMREDEIKEALAHRGRSMAWLSEIAFREYSRQNFAKKVKRGTLTDEECYRLAVALGAEYIPAQIVFPDGTIIGGKMEED